jgi:hypothetical protein
MDFVGPPEQGSDWSLADVLKGASSVIKAVVDTSNDIAKSLASSSVINGNKTRQDLAQPTKQSLPVWVWILGAAVIYKVSKG